MFEFLDQSLEFIYHDGDVTEVAQPHTTGWRTLPYWVTAKGDVEGMLEVEGMDCMRGSGGAMCVPPGVRHCCTLIAPRGISRWSSVTFSVLGGIELSQLMDPPLLIADDAAEKIGEINTELALIKNNSSSSIALVARKKALGFNLLSVIASLSKPRTSSPFFPHADRLVPVLTHIRKNLADEIQVGDLARIAHVSIPRFHKIFREGVGASPQQYVVRTRMRNAQELLLSTELSIGAIAARIGQHDPLYFSRTFKKCYGVSPKQYREKTTRASF